MTVRQPPHTITYFVSVMMLVAALASSLLVAVPRADGAVYSITHPIHHDHLDAVYWGDTWGAARSGGRSHIGVDIMGDRMIPLVAVNDSEVTWGEFDNAGGNIVRIRDTNGWEFQYIHINNDTPGTDNGKATCRQAFAAKICNSLNGNRIKRGLKFRAGELIAYLGDSGNAERTAPHLHFEVYAPNGDGSVSPVNPTPYVDAAARNQPPELPDTPLPDGAPWPDVATAVAEVYAAIEGRSANPGEAAALSEDLQNRSVAQALAAVVDDNNSAAMVDRLYFIFFGRTPDAEGYDYWIKKRGQGEDLADIADWFAKSSEYERRYGGGTFEQFLDRLYRGVFDRNPDRAGDRYWLNELEAGRVDRGTIVVYFSEGSEAVRLSKWRTERTVLERVLTGQRPSEAEIKDWARLRANTGLAPSIETLLD